MAVRDEAEADDGGEDRAIVEALRLGDEAAFATLVGRYHTTMIHVARGYVATREAAEDVVQETWLGVVRGIDSFEQRSSLKTWIFRILVNRARTRGERDSRSRPFSSLAADDAEPVVDPSRFIDSGRWVGHWSAPPPQQSIPEQRVLAREAGSLLIDAINQLPANQQIVISLRDVQGLGSSEVCELLEITEANQRVLLHRARSKVRGALEQYLDPELGMIVQPEVRCVEFVDELTDWMEGTLSDDQRSLIEEHLSICPHCTRYLEQLRAALGALRLADTSDTSAVLRDAVLAALRERRT